MNKYEIENAQELIRRLRRKESVDMSKVEETISKLVDAVHQLEADQYVCQSCEMSRFG